MKIKTLAALAAILILILSAGARADYRYDEFNRTIPAQASFTALRTCNGRQLGIGPFLQPSDMYVDDRTGQIFVLDAGNNRIVILNGDFELISVIDDIKSDGASEDIKGATGIFVDDEGLIYIADGPNLRVLVINREGEVVRAVTRPISGLLSDSINFIPRNMLIDKIGIMYIISQNSTQGAYMLDKNGEFLGFYGRNEVNITADVLYQALLREFATEKQRAGMSNFIPVEFSNFDVDDEGFIYTVTRFAESPRDFDMIRKLNPLGDNILTNMYRSFGDEPAPNGVFRTAYIDVVVDESGFIYALDSYNGRIFQYDDEGFQISIFGGKGNQAGCFTSATAIESIGSRILVLDQAKANITVFEETLFGNLLRRGMTEYNRGNLTDAMSYFEELVMMDANFFFAYYALADAHYELGNYEMAESYAKRTPVAKEIYSLAKKELRNQWIRDNFATIFFAVIALGIVVLFLGKVAAEMRRGERGIVKEGRK